MKHLSFMLLMLLPLLAAAQDEYYQKKPTSSPVKRLYSILLKDGTRLRGELVSQDSSEAVIRTTNLGEVRLKPDQIVRIEQVGAQAAGDTFRNLFPQTMRLVPTAFSAEKGRLYYRNYILFVSQFEYGITPNWSVGTTFGILSILTFGSLNTKVSLPVSSRVRLGINAQYAGFRVFPFFTFNSPTGIGVGYVQGMVTTGDRQNNTTYGLGSSISNGDLSSTVVGSFGLVRKVNPKLTFITENFILFGNKSTNFSAMLSGGIRFDRRRHAFDVAIYAPILSEVNARTFITLSAFGSYHLQIGR